MGVIGKDASSNNRLGPDLKIGSSFLKGQGGHLSQGKSLIMIVMLF
jgi:hypothetical protein